MNRAALALAFGLAVAFAAPRETPAARGAIDVMLAHTSTDPRPTADPSTSCVRCHADVAREWAASAHHHAASDPVYVEAVRLEPLPFCRACHAPSADPSAPTTAVAAERGIGCVDCHSGASAPHGSRGSGAAAPVPAPPTVTTVPCANCHEFPFPDGTPGMQRTATEHVSSAFATVACTGCHMRSAGGGSAPRHRDHTFAVTDAMIRAAVKADVARAGPAAVAVRLEPGRVGHAFPTGDLFRRVVVEVELRDEAGAPQASQRRDLGRTFELRPAGQGALTRVEIADERVGAGLEPCLTFDFAPVRAIARPSLHLIMAYERVAHPIGPHPDRAAVGRRVVLLEDVLDLSAQSLERPCIEDHVRRSKHP